MKYSATKRSGLVLRVPGPAGIFRKSKSEIESTEIIEIRIPNDIAVLLALCNDASVRSNLN